MDKSKINIGEYYLIKSPIFNSNGQIYKIRERLGDINYSFEVSAANYGVKPEDVFQPKDSKDLSMIKLLEECELVKIIK